MMKKIILLCLFFIIIQCRLKKNPEVLRKLFIKTYKDIKHHSQKEEQKTSCLTSMRKMINSLCENENEMFQDTDNFADSIVGPYTNTKDITKKKVILNNNKIDVTNKLEQLKQTPANIFSSKILIFDVYAVNGFTPINHHFVVEIFLNTVYVFQSFVNCYNLKYSLIHPKIFSLQEFSKEIANLTDEDVEKRNAAIEKLFNYIQSQREKVVNFFLGAPMLINIRDLSKCKPRKEFINSSFFKYP